MGNDREDGDTVTLRDAYLTPHRLDDGTRQAYGALYRGTGELVRASVRTTDQTDRHFSADPEALDVMPRYVGHYGGGGSGAFIEEAVFGGYFFQGWGHLITETLGTAWAAPSLGSCHLVLVPWERAWFSAIPRGIEVLRLAGWSGPISLLADGARFGTVHVPERLVGLREICEEACPIDGTMNSVYDRIAERAVSASGRVQSETVFFSRTPGHRRAHPQEAVVEDLIARSGVPVIRGWTLPVCDQIAIARGARTVIGFSGSNLHNSVFGGPDVVVVEILDERELERESTRPQSLQLAACRLRSQARTTVPGYRAGAPRNPRNIVEEVLARAAVPD